MLHLALKAAEVLSAEGTSVEVIDPRTVSPLDISTILESVHKTGRLVVASEDAGTCGFASEVVAVVAESSYAMLKAPAQRVCALDVPVPFSPDAEKYVLPNEEKIVATIRRTVQ
jgi:pyruvate/2-oxoglutarate/acetoin dehydrogenase E1 component